MRFYNAIDFVHAAGVNKVNTVIDSECGTATDPAGGGVRWAIATTPDDAFDKERISVVFVAQRHSSNPNGSSEDKPEVTKFFSVKRPGAGEVAAGFAATVLAAYTKSGRNIPFDVQKKLTWMLEVA